MHKINHHIELCSGIIALCLLNIVLTTGIILSSNIAKAESTTSNASVTVPEACTMTSTNNTPHTATLSPNTYSGASGSDYENGIGKTTLTVVCNDYNGFSIYAIGFTGNSYDSENHTKLVGNTTGNTISTKVYASTDTSSNWSMKVTKVTDSTVSYNPTNLTISTGYDAWHAIPDTYTKVAQYKANTGSSTTDTTLGVKLETTYAAYIAENQSADTYIGQVKYTMVHPYGDTPLQPHTSPSGTICYYPNGNNVEGTMGCQSVAASYSRTALNPSNFSRQGYGFAGWSDKFDYATNSEAKFYGPQEIISFTAGQYNNPNPGLSLYAVWVKSAGNLQDSSKVTELCGVGGTLSDAIYNDEADADESTWSIIANLDSVSALTDTRDGQTYAIAKLADGKCWMIENLRLADTHQEGTNTVSTTITISNTNNPLNDGAVATLKHDYSDTTTYPNLSTTSSDATSWCKTDSAACNNQSRLRTDNTANRASYPSGSTVNIYSYGNYYNWYSATAGRGLYSKSSGDAVGDICPYGWHMPTGSGSGEFGLLSNSLGGYKNTNNIALSMNEYTSPTAETIFSRLRHFPNNLLYSGMNSGSSIEYRGYRTTFWTSTAYSNAASYSLYYVSYGFEPGSYSFGYKYYGMAVRCIASLST